MPKLTIAIALLLLAVNPMPFSAQQSRQQAEKKVSDESAVRVVERYLHGLKFNDVDSLRNAFHPDAKLFFVDKSGNLKQLSQQQWYEQFKGSEGKEEKGELKIVAIDISGKAAAVKVREEYPGAIYTDYLSLLKFGGQWRIVNKSFDAAPRQK